MEAKIESHHTYWVNLGTGGSLGNQYENLRSHLHKNFISSVEEPMDPVTSHVVPGLWVVRGSRPGAWKKARVKAD